MNNETELLLFFQLGGHGLIQRDIAEKYLSDVIAPQVCGRDASLGFRCIAGLPEAVLRHAPSQHLRMKVLRRDQFRCLVCGERPSNNVHIELHVHHIRPWGTGGLTVENNLITLCHTCHGGLEPHGDDYLFNLIDVDCDDVDMDKNRSAFLESVNNYRKIRIHKRVAPKLSSKNRKPRARL